MYASPQLNVLALQCKHHVTPCKHINLLYKTREKRCNLQIFMPFLTSVPIRHSTQHCIYQYSIHNPNATLQLTISKRELSTKDSFKTFHRKRQSKLLHLNIISLWSNLSLKHEMLVEKTEVSSKIERRLTRLEKHLYEKGFQPKPKSILIYQASFFTCSQKKGSF